MVRCVTQNNKLQAVNLSAYMQCEIFGGMRGIIISVYLKKGFFIRNYIHIIQNSVSKTYKKVHLKEYTVSVDQGSYTN